MLEPKRSKKQTRTYEAPIEPAYHLRLVQHKPIPAQQDESGQPPLENEASLSVNPPESGLLSRLIERISKL